MYSESDEPVILERDCQATLVPFGNKVTLKKGEEGHITQALDGSYTIMIRGNLVRIESKDADAIGKIPEIQPWLEEIETDGRANENSIWEAMKTCYDPEIPVNIYELGLIYKIEIDEKNKVNIDMTLTSPNCPVAESLPKDVKTNIMKVEGVSDVNLNLVWDPPWNKDKMSEAAKLELNL